MTESDWLAKILDSKTAEKFYDDLLSKPSQETSAAIVDLIKALRLFTAPIQLLATYQDRLIKNLEQVKNKVPEGRHIKAPASISGPILEKFKYLEEGNILTELYMNLLARAIDKERIGEAHPAFFNIIEQLSPDEAMILYLLRDIEIHIDDTMDLDIPKNMFYNRKITKNEFPMSKLTFQELFEMYISHLDSLNLVKWPIYKQEAIMDGIRQTGTKRFTKIITTDFGKLFIKACIPEKME